MFWDYLLYFFIIVLTVLVAVLLVVLIRMNRSSSQSSAVYGWGGIDLANGQRSSEEIHGFRGLQYATRVKGNYVKACVFLEESLTRNQFCAELGTQAVIGRLIPGQNPMNDIAVSTSCYLSRQHCRLIEYNGMVYVENLSKMGTVLNGVEISQPMPIRRGDILLLGDVQLRVIGIEIN